MCSVHGKQLDEGSHPTMGDGSFPVRKTGILFSVMVVEQVQPYVYIVAS